MTVEDVGYAFFVGLGGLATMLIKRWHERRLQLPERHRRYRYLWVICLVGAVVGAKLGMLLYLPLERMSELGAHMASLRFDGKTILGALAGGYLFGEIGKKLLGIRYSTGDALAIALPVGQGIGRIGCAIAGCCYGSACSLGPFERHPVQLYEAGLDFALAGALFLVRERPRPAGHLFRYYLIGYAAIRLGLDAFRGEPQPQVGPLSYAQIYCGLAIALLVASLVVSRVRSKPCESSAVDSELPSRSPS